MAALAALALTGTAQATTPRMTRSVATTTANKTLFLGSYPEHADGSSGFQNLTAWRLNMNHSDGPEYVNDRTVHVDVYHRFRWRFTGHCTRINGATLECPIRFDIRWLTNRKAWPQYRDHKPPARSYRSTYRVAWVEVGSPPPSWIIQRVADGKAYAAEVVDGHGWLPNVHPVPTPANGWYDRDSDAGGWSLTSGPYGYWQGGADNPPEWYAGTWKCKWPSQIGVACPAGGYW
ncbi:MAG TPA: hypothetical protein VLA98_11800 [Solirubrobacteraceae bacterium]|nr:hypothetical protein [Solirubrobacteraceae bacterium]